MRDQDFYDAVLLNDARRLRELLARVPSISEASAAVGAFAEAVRYDRRELVGIYLGAGMPVDVRRNGDQTPLMWAADAGRHELLRELLDRGAEIDAADYRGWTALFYAVANQDLEAVRLLVEAGADICRRVADAQGGTPLKLAGWAIVAITEPGRSEPILGRSSVPVDTPVAQFLREKLREMGDL